MYLPASIRKHAPPLLAGAALAAVALAGGAVLARAGSTAPADPPMVLAPIHAAPAVTVDTLFVGGYARGSFTEALAVLASDLSPAERGMVGRHLDKIYLPVLQGGALSGGGRLRVAYERTRRPDGSTRSIQVLAAEAAVGGGMHTVFLYDQGEAPGYYDDLGRSLDPVAWSGPLAAMRVTSPFKLDRMHPLLRRILPHTGVDLAAGYGTPVRATGDGSVSFAAARGGYGNMVEIQHPNGYATRYAHLSRISPAVAAGMPVHQGDVIGYVGSSGLATGPHLHYEVRRKGRPVNPLLARAEAGSTRDVGYDDGWRGERRKLGRLLARTPSLVSRRAFK
ncbi:MAG TPA: M23 family metallopeptidase [Longimicrobium sp.]|nr:M23 family metallopeptidase [Longimicrobium sp.]